MNSAVQRLCPIKYSHKKCCIPIHFLPVSYLNVLKHVLYSFAERSSHAVKNLSKSINLFLLLVKAATMMSLRERPHAISNSLAYMLD